MHVIAVLYLRACLWGSVYVGIWCKEGLQRWGLREKAIILLFFYRAAVGIICTGCVGILELGGYFKTQLGFGGHCRPLVKIFPWLTHTIGQLAPKFHKAARFRPDWPITEVEFDSDSDDGSGALKTGGLEREVAQLLERISGDLGSAQTQRQTMRGSLNPRNPTSGRYTSNYPLRQRPPLCAQVELNCKERDRGRHLLAGWPQGIGPDRASAIVT